MNISRNPANKHKARLDQWAGSICKARLGGCESCGVRRATFDPGHIIRRTPLATRWLQGNLLKLCRTCHDDYGEHPARYGVFVLEYLGEHDMDILQELSQFQWPDLKFTVGEMKQIGELSLGEVLTMYRSRRGS